MNLLLETAGLTVTYGGVFANRGVNLRINEGSFVGIIGPNGAGKTTLIDAITGFTRPSEGTVVFDGRDITGSPSHRRARSGLSRTFQSLELFEDLSVFENLLVAAERPRWYSFLADMVAPRRGSDRGGDVAWALETVGLTDLATRLPTDLSHGQRKLVGVARALVTRPKLLLLDEPAAGLDTAESRLLGVELRGILDQGISILMIDHDMGLVLNVCDYIYVLDFGAVIAEGPPSKVRADPAVIAAYLGERAGEEKTGPGGAVPTPEPYAAAIGDETAVHQ